MTPSSAALDDRVTQPHVTRVLIANRGEIAIRIARACRDLDIESVAIYSDADRDAPHVDAADSAVYVGPTPARDSYLSIDRVIAAAREAGADAVHPGYGFLSENPEFVERCAAAGLTFIGPSASAMRALGDKARAKQAADAADVPTVPEWAAGEVPDNAYPVLVKAAAGGGGRGMRRVDNASELPGALESAAREAEAGFGDATLLVEQLVLGARHVEIQLLADAHGTCLYVGDRDCSLQRRHQKVIEEAPAPGLPHMLRVEMGEAAVRLAKGANYVGAGTAEFLVSPDGSFFFLELNARLQVEHPVTEEAFGIDLAAWQLRIARGEHLTVEQDSLVSHGHSIEARVYAENPVDFLPTGGHVVALRLPHTGSETGIRLDHAVRTGLDVSLAYDPLLAKVIATGASREAARTRLLTALRQLSILGVITNGALLQHALELREFRAATHTVETLEENLLDAAVLEPAPEIVNAARRQLTPAVFSDDPFRELGRWRQRTDDWVAAHTPELNLSQLHVATHGDTVWISLNGITWEIPRSPIVAAAGADAADDTQGDLARLVAPMPGTVVTALEPGTEVEPGDAVVVLEAMKMENTLAAPFAGRVGSVSCVAGDLVTKGTVLAEVTR